MGVTFLALITMSYAAYTEIYGHQVEIMFERAADAIVKKLGMTLALDENGDLELIGHSFASRVYVLQGGGQVLKVQSTSWGNESIIGRSAPDSDKIAGFTQVAETTLEGNMKYYGAIMPRILGNALSVFDGKVHDHATNEEGLKVAADLAVALHVLHTKMKGYIVLHCNLQPPSVVVTPDFHGVLLNFQFAMVHKTEPGEVLTKPVFWERSRWSHCRGTNWDDYIKGTLPYSPMVEWRELAILLYRFVEYGSSQSNDASKKLFAQVSSACDYKCAALAALDSTNRLRGALKDLVQYLLINHTDIQDEVTDVLQHRAFADLPDGGPAAWAARVPEREVTTEFEQTFGGPHNLMLPSTGGTPFVV